MKTKTNRKVKRSKKTRRTRRNLRKVRGGGLKFIEKGRDYLEWRRSRNEAIDEIDTSYRTCKLDCEMKHNTALRDVKNRYDKIWDSRATAQASQVTSPTKIPPRLPTAIELQRQQEKDEYDQSGAAAQVTEYKRQNKNKHEWMDPTDFPKLDKHDSHREQTPTDNGWYVDLLTDPKIPFLQNTKNSSFNLKTYGIQNDYEAHLDRLPNPSFKYKSPIPSSPDYILVQKGTGELEWKNLGTEKLIEFSPIRPLLITNDQEYEVVLHPTSEPAQ